MRISDWSSDVCSSDLGFRADRFLRPIEVRGRDGIRLDDVWADRPSAHVALAVPGFPNLFLLNGPNGPVGNFSPIDVAELPPDSTLQLLYLLTARPDSLAPTAAAAVPLAAPRPEGTESPMGGTGWRR